MTSVQTQSLDQSRADGHAERRGAPEAVIVAQLGARMHYAVPEILAAEGRLAHLYTDVHGGGALGRLVGAAPRGLLPTSLRRLVDRAPAIAPRLTTSFDLFGLAYAWRRSRVRTIDEDVALNLWAGRAFSERVAARDFGDAGAVYAFNSAALELAKAARRRGLRVFVEQTIAPRRLAVDILAREQRRFPGWDRSLASDRLEGAFAEREAAEWESADVILCGSAYVRDGIAACGGPVDRCVVAPYGAASPIVGAIERDGHAGPLRILTVGQVGLRKGSPYVVEAARRLRRDADFRLVGSIAAPSDIKAELAGVVTLTGPTPRSAIAAHYAWADVFLLPSLHEGSATAIYEALASGLPVICTPNAGSLVRDGRDGFIVPPGDVDAIVGAIEKLQDARLRARMSAWARETSRVGSVVAYRARLLAALAAPERRR